MTIRIQMMTRSVYGEDKIYPANEAAEHLATIAGTKTLTIRAIHHALLMGCEVELVGREPRLFTRQSANQAVVQLVGGAR